MVVTVHTAVWERADSQRRIWAKCGAGNGTGQERHGPTAAADGADRIISKSQPKNLRPLPGGGGEFEAKYWSKSETGQKG